MKKSRKKNKSQNPPKLKILDIVDNADQTTSVSFRINDEAEELFKAVYGNKKMSKKAFYQKIGESILKFLNENS